MNGPSLPDALARLRSQYVQELPARANELAEALRAAAAGDDAARTRAARLLHAAGGTSSTHGLHAFAALAREAEVAVSSSAPAAELESLATRLVQAGQHPFAEPPSPHEGLATEVLILPAPPRPGPRLLYVGSDRELLIKLSDVARSQLWELDSALGESEAVQAACASRPDAIVVGMDDERRSDLFRLLARLRSLNPEVPTPVALVDGRGSMSDRVRAAAAGVCSWIEGDAEPHRLAPQLEELLAEGRAMATPITALVIDEDDAARQGTLRALAAGGVEAHGCGPADQLIELLEERRPDALLLASRSGELRGAEVCRAVRCVPRHRDLPIIVLGSQGDADRLDAIHAGADDVLDTAFAPERLLSRLRLLVVRARTLSERADLDPLTGLLLRRPFLDRLAARLADARRRRSPLTVGVIDLDHFKAVNDAAGHLAADRLLAAFGRVLLGTFRLEDLRCRWGGDEFALAFPGQSADAAQLALQRAEPRARAIRIDGVAPRGVLFSAGTATFPQDGLEPGELLRVADQRLYRAKASGRGRAVIR